jgi:hypothetical protein
MIFAKKEGGGGNVSTTNVLKDNERQKNSLTAEQAVLMGTPKPSFQQQAALKMQGEALAC